VHALSALEKPKAIKFGELAALPGNTVTSLFGKGRFDEQFVETRRAGLQQFINDVAKHNFFRFQKELHAFLQNQDAVVIIHRFFEFQRASV
jgi:hypothetical protein